MKLTLDTIHVRPDGKTIFGRSNFEIAGSGLIAVMGPSGGGKTGCYA